MRAQGLAQKTTAEWLVIFAEKDVPAARYNSIDDLLEDPHLTDVGFYTEADHPSEGRILNTKVPNTFSGGMRTETKPAPRLGEQSRQILTELGYSADAIADLIETGAAIEPN